MQESKQLTPEDFKQEFNLEKLSEKIEHSKNKLEAIDALDEALKSSVLKYYSVIQKAEERRGQLYEKYKDIEDTESLKAEREGLHKMLEKVFQWWYETTQQLEKAYKESNRLEKENERLKHQPNN